MTPESQRIAIAEACGWAKAPYSPTDYYVPMQRKVAVACDPLNDLNAMHEAEKVLTPEQVRQYWTELVGVCAPSREYWRATAAQRAEAFLRTIGKWEDGK